MEICLKPFAPSFLGCSKSVSIHVHLWLQWFSRGVFGGDIIRG
jgi:hypothetical protein